MLVFFEWYEKPDLLSLMTNYKQNLEVFARLNERKSLNLVIKMRSTSNILNLHEHIN